MDPKLKNSVVRLHDLWCRLVAFFPFIIGLLLVFKSDAQSSKDSLFKVWSNQKLADTVRFKALDDLIWNEYMYSNPDSALYFSVRQEKFSISRKLTRKIPTALSNQASAYFVKSEFKKSISIYKSVAQLERKNRNSIAEATAWANIANIYLSQDDYTNALNFYYKALELFDSKNVPEKTSFCYNSIGTIYGKLDKLEMALNCFQKAKDILEKNKLTQTSGYGVIMAQIGAAKFHLKQYEESIRYFGLANAIAISHNDKLTEVNSLVNLSAIFIEKFKLLPEKDKRSEQKLLDTALVLIDRVIADGKMVGLPDLVAAALFRKANVYMIRGEVNPVKKMLDEAFQISVETKNRESLVQVYNYYANYFELKSDYKNAFLFHNRFIHLRDSLQDIKNLKDAMQRDFEFTYSKKKAADSLLSIKDKQIHSVEIQKKEAEIRGKKLMLWYVVGGLLVIVFFSILLYKRLRITRNQKAIIENQRDEVENQKRLIEQQKKMVEQKNHEMLDSINYAQRIQDAYLPPEKVLHYLFPNSFLLFKPKDIVSGDFYWFYTAGAMQNQRTDTVFFAVADCTGHGVPGALMSVICCNALNEVVVNKGTMNPGKILDETRELVIRNLKGGSASEQKDGMDITLCSLNKSTLELSFAGANNNLLVVKNNRTTIELKADKQPVGTFEKSFPFNTQTLQLEAGDCLYLFSDGFADQFGGPKGKKYKYANLYEFLGKGAQMDAPYQLNALKNEFLNWKGDLEQVDDVCVIGIKI